MSLSEYVENRSPKIISKLMNKVHLRVFALDVHNCLSVGMKS